MDTTDMEKLRILTMWECGKSTTEIAKSINKSKRTVQRWLAHQKKEGNMNKKKRGMRPRKTTPEEDAKIVQLVKENPDLTQKEILTICNLNIYKGTLRRRLQEANGTYKLDLFQKPKGHSSKKVKKSKGDLITGYIENTSTSTTLLERFVSPPRATSPEFIDCKSYKYDTVDINQSEFIIENNELTVQHEEEFTNDDPSHFEDATFTTPVDTDGLFGISNSDKDSFTDAENVFNELMTNVTQIVKVEILEQSNNTPTYESLDSEDLSETLQVLGEEVVVEMKHSEPVDNTHFHVEVHDPVSIESRENESATLKRLKTERNCDHFKANRHPRNTKVKMKRPKKKRNEDNTKLKGKRKNENPCNNNEQKEEMSTWVRNGKDTTETEKAKILIMSECGMSTSEIAKSLKKSRRTVQRWLSKHNKGFKLDRKERGRRPRKTTPEEDAQIVQLVRENPQLSRREILELGNINLHKVTLRNRLNEAGLFFNSQRVKILDYSEDQIENSQSEGDESINDSSELQTHHLQLSIHEESQPQSNLRGHPQIDLTSPDSECTTLTTIGIEAPLGQIAGPAYQNRRTSLALMGSVFNEQTFCKFNLTCNFFLATGRK